MKNATLLTRGLCSPPSIALQQSTAASQGRFIYRFLQRQLGAKVDLFLSANRCPGHSWEEQVRDMYKPWLKQLSLDNCLGSLGRRCLLQRGLAMVLAVAAKDYDVVLFTRPDLVFKPSGAGLVRDIVLKAANTSVPRTIVWPFKCETNAWRAWQCVPDMVVGVPSSELQAFFDGCLGHVGCHPDAYENVRTFQDVPQYEPNPRIKSVQFNGHRCYKCVEARRRAKGGGGGLLGRRGVRGLIVHEELAIFANTRSEIGQNRFYSIMDVDQADQAAAAAAAATVATFAPPLLPRSRVRRRRRRPLLSSSSSSSSSSSPPSSRRLTSIVVSSSPPHAALRVAVLSYGLLARGAKNATTVPRGLCSPPSIALQQSTAASQGRFIFNFLEGRLGAKVDLFLSANRCPGHSWEEQVRDMYKPWLKQLSLDNCNGMLMRRCLLQRGLAMVLAVAAKDYDVVLFTRPDLVFTPSGAGLVRDMVTASANTTLPLTLAWPFKCETNAWRAWQCVPDMMVSVPSSELQAFFDGCLGHVGCHPDAYENVRTFQDVPQYEPNPRIKSVQFNGHRCYKCVEARRRAGAAGLGQRTRAVIVRDDEILANTRSPIGQNRYYSIMAL